MIEKTNYRKRGKLFDRDTSLKVPKATIKDSSIGKMRNSSLNIGFSKKERQNHTHVLGSTGTGKSKFLEALLRQDILDKNCGLCLLDPHGSLYDEILLYTSHRYPNLADRIILFNPAEDLKEIVGFNPIYENANIDYLLDILISSCLKAWGQDNIDETPRISRWLRNVFYPLIKNDLTLLEAPVLINTNSKEKTKRSILLSKVNNISVLNDWSMFDDAPLRERMSYIEGVSNRLNKFLLNETIRNIIGQTKNKLDFSKAMKEGKIVLINLNGKDKISYENSQLLGIMLVNEIFRVAKLRDPRDTKLKPFYFYIDEFAQFVTKDIARSLDETRKFKLFMILAHQHLGQLKKEDEYLYASVMTNCKNKVVFGGLSVEDTDIMTHELQTGFIGLKQIKSEMYKTRVAYKEQTKETVSISEGQGEASNWSDSTNSSKSTNSSTSINSSDSTNHSDTTSRSNTRSTGESSSSSENRGVSNQYSEQSVGVTGHNQMTGNSTQRGYSSGNSTQEGSSQTDGHSRTEGHTETEGVSNAEGSSKSTGGASSKTSGRSVSTSTGFSPYQEEQELSSREFWSKDELLFMKMGDLKNQDVAEAFIKIGSKAPIRCKIQEVKQVHYNKRFSPEKIEKFRQLVIEKQTCYTPLVQAKLEYQERQTILFGEPLQFDDEEIVSETVGGEPEHDSKFNS